MWQQLSDILAGIPKLPDEDGQPWHRLWPMLILVALYALSGWIKNKQSKQSPPPSQPKPTPPRQQTRSLPSYARKRIAHKQAQQPSRPVQQPSRPAQQPSRPIPTIERPVPTARRPAGPQITRRPAVQRQPVTKPPKHTAAAALAGQLTKDQITAKRQMTSTRKAVQLRRASHKKKKTAAATQTQAVEPLQQVLRNRNTAAQAIVMAEILGQPLGLRINGSYEFIS
ncbi:MAG: hypothetical protein KAJ52_09410 [Sedimentisphaerales bacterium]|nr:hypothetical protein [Sedimentisphaerales bacterium]